MIRYKFVILFIFCDIILFANVIPSSFISFCNKSGETLTLEISDIQFHIITPSVQNITLINGESLSINNNLTDSVLYGRELTREKPLLFTNLPHRISKLSYLNRENNIFFFDDTTKKMAKGFIQGDGFLMTFDSENRILRYKDSEVCISINYEGLSQNFIKMFISNLSNGTNKMFLINFDIPLNTKINKSYSQITNNKILTSIINEMVDSLEDNPLMKALQAFKLLYQTNDMDHNEAIDYIENDGYKIIPRNWINHFLDYFYNEIDDNIPPTFFIDIKTGNAYNVNSWSAELEINGYIQAYANDGSFAFEYGILYSNSPNITYQNSNHISKNVYSGLLNSINCNLPENFHINNLIGNTRYYYRAFWRNLNDPSIIEYGDLQSFETEPFSGLIIKLNFPPMENTKRSDDNSNIEELSFVERDVEFILNTDLSIEIISHSLDNPCNTGANKYHAWDPISLQLEGIDISTDGYMHNDNGSVSISYRFDYCYDYTNCWTGTTSHFSTTKYTSSLLHGTIKFSYQSTNGTMEYCRDKYPWANVNMEINGIKCTSK
jgi:hypothetical protein